MFRYEEFFKGYGNSIVEKNSLMARNFLSSLIRIHSFKSKYIFLLYTMSNLNINDLTKKNSKR
jgi:hypothetical protein